MNRILLVSSFLMAIDMPVAGATQVDQQFAVATGRCEALGYNAKTWQYQDCVREQLRLLAGTASSGIKADTSQSATSVRPVDAAATGLPSVSRESTKEPPDTTNANILTPSIDGKKYFEKNTPPFPIEARARLYGGEAIVKITISASGSSSCVVDESTGSSIIDESILAWCAKAPRFTPAMRNGVAEEFSFRKKYTFHYRGSFDYEVSSLLKKAESGDVESQFRIGMIYREGLAVEKNGYEAAKWIRSAAEKGHQRAQGALGELYYEGFGVSKDYGEAVKWVSIAAKTGLYSAQTFLGQLYLRGHGVERNYHEAEQWLRAAAVQDDRGAHLLLSRFYTDGIGRDPDKKIALAWIYLAAGKNGERSRLHGGSIKQLVSELDKASVDWARKTSRDCRISRFKKCSL